MQTIRRYILFTSIIMVVITSFGQSKTPNQQFTYKSGDPTSWPAVFDAILAAPKNHKILLENEKTRVLEVTLLPGETENLHHHRWPSVLYIQEAGDFVDYDEEGNVIFDSRTLTEPLKFPLTMYKDSEAPHYVVNLSKTKPIRLIRVEMKQ
ncbi:MAG: hypothetical protein KDD03_12140 [Gelidibacter sp.]|nr:hypothetical protein [Gelidibacter sp.]